MGDRLRQLEEPLRSQAQSVWRDLHASAARSGQANVATAERIAKITRDSEAAHAALRSRASGAAGAIKGMHPRTAVFGAVAVGALAFGAIAAIRHSKKESRGTEWQDRIARERAVRSTNQAVGH